MSGERVFTVGQEVKLWAGLTLYGYPERGKVIQFLPNYPGGPTYEVAFAPSDFVVSACLKPEWIFPA